MFCPQCKMEYRPEITKCPDCDAWLVASLPTAPEESHHGGPDYGDLVTVFRTSNYSDLLIAKSMLESAGIEFWTNGDSLSSVFYSGSILIKPEDESEAGEILAELETSEESGEETGD